MVISTVQNPRKPELMEGTAVKSCARLPVIKFTAHRSFPVNMANTKQKGITYTPPTKKRLPQLYKLKEKTTTRGSRSSWVKDSWARKTKSVTSSPIKSPSKHKSGSPHLLYEGADFEFDQGNIPQPKFPKSQASNSYLHFPGLTGPYRVRMHISGNGNASSRTT